MMAIYPVKKDGKAIRGKYRIKVWHLGHPTSEIVNGTRKQAEQREVELRAELRARDPIAYRTAPTFSDFSTSDYKTHARQTLAPQTWTNRRYQLRDLDRHFGPLALDAITTADVYAYQTAKLDSGVGPVKINDDLKVLRRVLAYAVEVGAIASIPKWRRLKEPKTKGRAVPWSVDEVARLYASLKLEALGQLPDADDRPERKQARHAVPTDRPSLVPMVALMLNTGMRKGEVIALEWSAIDLESGLIRIWPNAEWRPKSNEPREVPIGAAVRPWLAVPASQRPSARYVFPSSRRDKVSGELQRFARWPQRRFDAAREHAGLVGGPHTCRHTYASHFLQAQPDLFLLSKVLGHTHARVTQLYAHLMPGHLARARDAVSLPVPMGLVGLEENN